jgi:Haemolymph juvenile hormone binding protein (JHBP)
MNKFLNEKWRPISKDIKPELEEAIAKIIRSIADRVFDLYTVDQLLPA